MKISNLMIHDWYYDVSICEDKEDPNDKYREARQVGSIEHYQYDNCSEAIFRVNANLHYPKNWLPSQEKNIRPIPLRKEFFVKNGFREDCHTFVYRGTDFLVKVRIDKFKRVEIVVSEDASFNSDKINNVHEFQHVLRACGLEDFANNLIV